MKRLFREWYAPSEAELNQIWADGLVVLDANVLLNLYLYPESTRNEFLEVLKSFGDRLWLPHQVALEFHRNREAKLPEQRSTLDALLRQIDEVIRSIERLAIPPYHPTLDQGEIDRKRNDVRIALDELTSTVAAARDNTPEATPDVADPIRDALTSLYEGRVGDRFTAQELRQLIAEGDDRYARNVPPGYRDQQKDAERRYNDLIIWKQILAKAAGRDGAAGLPSILVTNDRKEDWWRRHGEQLLGPRTELRSEHLEATGCDFVLYLPEQFLDAARGRSKVSVSVEAIADVRRVSAATPVGDALAIARMVVPSRPERIRILGALYEILVVDGIKVVDELNEAITRLPGARSDGNVSVPLFWSLIHEVYGPVRVSLDSSLRLRERPIERIEAIASREEFVERAEAAWLAQALFRLQHARFREEDLLTAFFGSDYDVGAPKVLARAQDMLDAELTGRLQR